jgi:hypothetical protein
VILSIPTSTTSIFTKGHVTQNCGTSFSDKFNGAGEGYSQNWEKPATSRK